MVGVDPGDDAGSVPHLQSIRFGRPGGISARVVVISSGGALVPPECACCGAVAGVSRVESSSGQSLIVPYCEGCLRHATRGLTRDLSASLAGCLLAATASIALPLTFEGLSLFAHTVMVMGVAVLPILVRWLWRPRRGDGHTATERAVWWVPEGLACTHPRFADELARANDGRSEPRAVPHPAPAPWVYAGVVLALVAAPVGWTFTHPRVRVLNLTPERLIVSVDGKTLVSIDPTSAESPAAGLSLRFPSGRHTLTAKNPEGRVVYDAEVTIRPGAEHFVGPRGERHLLLVGAESLRESARPSRGPRPGGGRALLGAATGGHLVCAQSPGIRGGCPFQRGISVGPAPGALLRSTSECASVGKPGSMTIVPRPWRTSRTTP